MPKFLAVEPETDSQDQTQCDEIDQLQNGCKASFVGSFPSQIQSRYRDDEDGGGPRILESQPEYSQDAQHVDDELCASFDDSTNVPSKNFISSFVWDSFSSADDSYQEQQSKRPTSGVAAGFTSTHLGMINTDKSNLISKGLTYCDLTDCMPSNVAKATMTGKALTELSNHTRRPDQAVSQLSQSRASIMRTVQKCTLNSSQISAAEVAELSKIGHNERVKKPVGFECMFPGCGKVISRKDHLKRSSSQRPKNFVQSRRL